MPDGRHALADKKNDTYRILDDANLPEGPVPPTELQIVLMGIAAVWGQYRGSACREVFEPSLASEDEVAHVQVAGADFGARDSGKAQGFFKSGRNREAEGVIGRRVSDFRVENGERLSCVCQKSRFC